jgi:hypothetical protein
MNIRRGLSRLWVVVSVPWVGLVFAFHADSIWTPPLPYKDYLYVTGAKDFIAFPNPWSYYEAKKNHQVVEFDNNVRLALAPELPQADVKAVAPAFHAKYVQPRSNEFWLARFGWLAYAAAIALIPPAILFAIGSSLVWAFAGFARSKHPQSE